MRDEILDVDRVNARGRGPAPQRRVDAIDRFELAFDVDLDPAVGEVANPPIEALSRGRRLGEEPESNPLYASGDQITARCSHATREL
jgi:hypothetical protein